MSVPVRECRQGFFGTCPSPPRFIVWQTGKHTTKQPVLTCGSHLARVVEQEFRAGAEVRVLP